MNVTSVPLAFAAQNLKDIHDVLPRSSSEGDCFEELQAVLKRYGLEKRYGITLLHKHFDLYDDEILVEETDIERRILTSRPVKIGSIPETNIIEVTWSLDTDSAIGACKSRCVFNQGSHSTFHTAEGP